jgi:ribulose kinase
MDQRAFREAEEISATNDRCLECVSGVVSPEWMLPKALWLKRHEPEVYGRTERMVECTDWFMFRLTGRWTLSLNNITVKWDYARSLGGWKSEFLTAIGLSEIADKWPTAIVPLGKGESRLSAPAARDLGLRAGIPVAQGGIDAYLGMLGLGVLAPVIWP